MDKLQKETAAASTGNAGNSANAEVDSANASNNKINSADGAQGNNVGQDQNSSSGFWDTIQTGLDVVGLIPVVGEIADLASAGISLARGDFEGAALSVASMVPIVGSAAGVAKIGRRVNNAVADVTKSVKGLETRGYKPKLGERTVQGQVDAVTQSGNPTIQRGGQDLVRLRSSGHGQSGATATPQNVRNVAPNGQAFTGKGVDRAVTQKDISELYKAQIGQGTSTLRTRSGR